MSESIFDAYLTIAIHELTTAGCDVADLEVTYEINRRTLSYRGVAVFYVRDFTYETHTSVWAEWLNTAPHRQPKDP